MLEPKRHPDLCTPAEAMEYLTLPADSDRTLKTFRDKGWLRGIPFGPDGELRYLRADLDRCVAMAFGVNEKFMDAAKQQAKNKSKGPHLRIAGGAV